MTLQARLFTVLMLALALSSCGGTDPAAGSWKSVAINGTTTTTIQMTLSAAGTATWNFVSVTTGDCTTTIAVTGTWATNAGMITLTFTSGTDTKTGCMTATQNASGPATSSDLATISGTYTVTGTTLFINAGGQTYNFTKS